MQTYRIISDVHLESREEIPESLWANEPSINRGLILAGDIGDPFERIYETFLEECKKRYKDVLLIAGNREFYNCYKTEKAREEVDSISRSKKYSSVYERTRYFTFEEVEKQLSLLCHRTGCIFLNRTNYKIGNNVFIGCPLWSSIPPNMKSTVIMHEYNPFKYIRVTSEPLTVDEYQQLHIRDVNWLESYINITSDKNEKIVVVTHYPPTSDFRQPRVHEDFLAKIFENNLSHLFNDKVIAWICGHSHHSVSLRKNNGLILASNPVGSVGHSDTQSNYDRNFSLYL